MTSTLPLHTDTRSLPTMTDPAWNRPIVPELIAAGLDLTSLCCCGTKMIDHDGPLIADGLYGSEACAEAGWYAREWTQLDGGWVR